MRKKIQTMMPIAGQTIIAQCPRHAERMRATINDYPGNLRYVDCSMCGLRYFWQNRAIMRAEGFHTPEQIEDCPEQGRFYSDRTLKTFDVFLEMDTEIQFMSADDPPVALCELRHGKIVKVHIIKDEESAIAFAVQQAKAENIHDIERFRQHFRATKGGGNGLWGVQIAPIVSHT